MGLNISRRPNDDDSFNAPEAPFFPSSSTSSSSRRQRRLSLEVQSSRRRRRTAQGNVAPLSSMVRNVNAVASSHRTPGRLAQVQPTLTVRQDSPAYPLFHPYDDGLYVPAKFNAILAEPCVDEEIIVANTWNINDRSLNILISEERPLTFLRHPAMQSTDCIRGKVGYSRGFHVWKITYPKRMRGTHAVIGVATKEAPLHEHGYSSMIGNNPHSYGWDLIRLRCQHDAKRTNKWSYPLVPQESGFSPPCDIYCMLDMDEGYLAFGSATTFYGIAFRGLKGKTLYPIVSAVWGHCEVTLKYIGNIQPEPQSLVNICRHTIRTEIGRKDVPTRIRKLPLPNGLKNFVLSPESY